MFNAWNRLWTARSLIDELDGVINPNGTSPSEWRHFLCWRTKGHLWIEGCLKHYRWACYEIHSLSIQLAIFTFEYVNCCTRICLYSTRVHTRLFLQHVAYCMRVFVIATRVQNCMRVSLRETRVSYTGCQYQYPRMLFFDIKNNKSRLFEIC